MAFETLSEKFSALFKKMRKEDKLTEANVESAIREIRIALLEADVNFKVVKAFTEDVREKALGQEVLLKVNPSQQFIKICHDELVSLLGRLVAGRHVPCYLEHAEVAVRHADVKSRSTRYLR